MEGITITLGPNATYRAEDLVIHRKYKGECDENLVKWVRIDNKDAPRDDKDADERTSKEYLVWMRRLEMEACCPHLLSLERFKSAPTAAQAAGAVQQPKPSGLPLEAQGDESLHEMADDINNLVTRAQRIMRKPGHKPGGVGGKMLSNILSILSAYAKIGALANIFRESGAMDILLSLLSSQDLDVRRSASDMLQSLAEYDSGSRAYVLLQLTRGESGPAGPRSTQQSRQMLLDLFADTASGDESELLLSGITLPPVPGRFIFSILKKYLRVMSLTKNYTISTPLPEVEDSPVPESEFELFYATFQLITELFSVFNWYEGTLEEQVQKGMTHILKGLSIFTGTVPTEEAIPAPKKKKNPFKRREDFTSDREYGQYTKATLQAGMRVRARVNYESVSEGDYGIYKQTNDGTPPAQFAWDGLGGDTYWVYWHMVEILPPASEDDDENQDPAMAAYRQPNSRQPYVMRSLALPSTTGGPEGLGNAVNHTFWWEVLCLVKPLSPKHIAAILSLLNHPELKTFDDLIYFRPTYQQVAEVVQYLEGNFPHLAQEPLSIKEMSRFRNVYHDPMSDIAPAKDATPADGLGPSVDEGPYKKEAPYPDPYDIEDPIHSPLLREFPASLEDAPLSLIRTLSGFLRHRREESDPLAHMRSLEQIQDGTLSQMLATKEVVEKYIEKYPKSCRLATQCLRALRIGAQLMKSETDRQELCVTGLFGLILRLMHVEPSSCILQCAGLECFFTLMGSFSIHQSLPRPNPERERKQELLSEQTQTLIIATVLSLSSSTEYGGLKAIVDAMFVIWEQYNLGMNATQKRNCVLAIRNGLCIIAALLSDADTQQKMEGWKIPELLEGLQKRFPTFSIKKELCRRIAAILPGCSQVEDPSESMNSPDAIKKLTREIVSVIKTLRKVDDIYSKNPIPRLLKLMDHDITTNDPFLRPHATFVSLFLLHQGVFYLTIAMESNRSAAFIENALTLLGSLTRFGEEEAAEVVLQGGLRALVTCMNAYPGNRLIQKLCLLILQFLAKDPDHLVIMAYENAIPALRNTKEKYATDDELCLMITELLEQCDTRESRRATHHQTILSIIFSGLLQMVLANVEEARRSNYLITLPKFTAFIKYLSAGSGGTVSVGEKEKWWEKIEVSSNTHRRERLVDGDASTYWESSGRSGTHWVRLYMKKGLVVRRMAIEVNSSDSSYMPQRVTVQGGSVPDNVQDISTVYIPSTFTGSFEIVTNAKRHYPVIVIRIKRCQQGGIDARIREITCQAARSSLWPLFGDLFSTRSKLFYHIQVQMWLKNPALGPLELFDKLSYVVLHEQMFADNFFMTPPARHCLGQACRSALITPLIDTLTQQSETGPNLRELIHEYIIQMQPPLSSQWRALTNTTEHGDVEVMSYDEETFDFTKAQNRLVHMSRIRRMCRLLVDCDDNTTSKKAIEEEAEEESEENEEGEDPTPPTTSPPVTAGTGTVAMARCWRDIVHMEVTQTLKKFDSTDSPHTVASDVLNIYNQLKQAMLELFGGHSQFALALKEGFSKAFQSLDEVTGVRFCELLCLCIDSLMDAAGKDTQRFQYIGEHQREAMLLHLAEPLQFLHNLDISHVFEHYYRRNLAARLLRGRTISLSLERRLVQAFAHCFPHKYPLQMLQDLDESGIQMDRFCDNELLESLDQLIVQASTPTRLSSEVMELAQKCSFYRQRILQVYTLNPCFWPLKQRPLPPFNTLPPPLGPFCEDYNRFYHAVHEHGLQQHEKARKLHWTLYGWASLAHCGLKLLVSTVQMIILLQFNNAEVHSLKSLHEVTQLAYQDLCDALLALTADRQCVLLTNQPSPHEAASPTPALEEDNYLQTTPFKLNTAFLVNAAFSADVARKQKSNKVRFHDVRLVNRNQVNVSSREERTVDLAHVFERRRAIMDSAIVRILKQEKEMSVDNIAFMVIKGCSVGQFERGAAFGRFDCDYRDVCSRIDRLIVDGYARRDEANQQMLLYVPDPNIGKEEEEEEEEEEEIPKEPDQREKEKPKAAPSSKEKSQREGSDEPGLSKLLPRKRPGANRPAGVKFKRKTQAFTRLYSNEMYERDDAPLLGMFPTSRSLSIEEVQTQINSLLETITQILKVDKDVLEHLLCHCKWNKDILIQRHLNHATTLKEEAGLAGEAATTIPSPKKQLSCPVCLQSVSYAETAWLWCNHACCKSCWQQHVLAQIDLNRTLLCSCPVNGCHARPTRAFYDQLFDKTSEAITKFSKAIVRSYVERSGRLTWCRNPQGCDQVLCRGDGMDTGTCSKCLWSSCFSCHFIEAHQPASCLHMAKWVETGGFYEGMDEDSKSKQLAALIAKRCPSCNAQIEKNEGCLNMKCKCGHSFCWKCMKPWKPTHTDYYNCTSKVSKAAADHRRFADYNQRCTSHHKSKMFAEKLCRLVKGISESVPMKTLSFVSDACQLLVQCHKMSSYACIAEFFSESDSMAYLSFLCENLEGDTNALQAFLENTLLSMSDVAHAIRTLPERRLLDGYRLVSKIESTRDKLLLGFHQQFKLGEAPSLKTVSEVVESAKDSDGSRFRSAVIDEEDELEDEDEEDEHYSEDNLSYVYSDYDDSLHGYDSYDDPYDSDMFPF